MTECLECQSRRVAETMGIIHLWLNYARVLPPTDKKTFVDIIKGIVMRELTAEQSAEQIHQLLVKNEVQIVVKSKHGTHEYLPFQHYQNLAENEESQ